MRKPYVIVWDLDGTLGDFYPLEKRGDGNAPVTIRTRPGLANTLQALGHAGFIHSLLTMATPRYAEMALRGTGLRQFFGRVEGQGERRKGDVAGLASAFGIPLAEASAQMLFVGDRMVFDEPDDPEVVFHLEPFALTRPAAALERLVMHLREVGQGSMRQGFHTIGRGPRRWYHLRRQVPLPIGKPSRRYVRGLGSLVMLERPGECPVIGYERAPTPASATEEHTFIPSPAIGQGEPDQPPPQAGPHGGPCGFKGRSADGRPVRAGDTDDPG